LPRDGRGDAALALVYELSIAHRDRDTLPLPLLGLGIGNAGSGRRAPAATRSTGPSTPRVGSSAARLLRHATPAAR
jgi:hypothetical protein